MNTLEIMLLCLALHFGFRHEHRNAKDDGLKWYARFNGVLAVVWGTLAILALPTALIERFAQ